MKYINRNKNYLLVTVVLIVQTVLTTLSAQIKGDSLVNVAFNKAETCRVVLRVIMYRNC